LTYKIFHVAWTYNSYTMSIYLY